MTSRCRSGLRSRRITFAPTRSACWGSRVWEADVDGASDGRVLHPLYHEEMDAFHFTMHGPALVHPSVTIRRDPLMAVGGYHNLPIAEEV